MNGMGADYWREMGLVVPTWELVAERQNEDVKFEASVLDSILTLPEDKILPQDDAERSLLELRLQVPETGLLFNAYFVVARYLEGVGILYTSRTNFGAAKLLNSQIRSETTSLGVFGGTILLAETLMSGSRYINLRMAYAEFPKESGMIYLFNMDAPFESSPRKL